MEHPEIEREKEGGYNFIFLTAKVARLQNIESIDADHRERNICIHREELPAHAERIRAINLNLKGWVRTKYLN